MSNKYILIVKHFIWTISNSTNRIFRLLGVIWNHLIAREKKYKFIIIQKL